VLKRFIPEWLEARFSGRATVRRITGNAAWLSIDQALRMAVGLLVGVWIARYLGPEQYGWLSYALAVVAMVGSLASLGINAVVVRELVRAPGEVAEGMGTALFLRSVAAGVGYVVCLSVAALMPTPDVQVRWLIVVVGSGLLLQALDVVDLLFQSRGESRLSAWVRMCSCVLGAGLKVALILTHAPLIAFGVAGVVELAMTGAGWLWMARRKGMRSSDWRGERARAVALLRESWPIAISGLAISAQAYVDQIVIGAMLEAGELGQYAAAVRLVSVFAFIPTVVLTAAAPEITRAKGDDLLYRKRLHGLYRLMFGLFLITALPLILVGPGLTTLLYGSAYAGAAALLPWLALRLFFTNLGVARSAFIVNEGLFRFALVTAIAGAIVNIALNLILVPRWGAMGAIVSSLASFGVTTFALEGFHLRARGNLRLMFRAVFLPWRPFST
jgi:O-antigen/teichoic acid export membrane protein